MRKEYLVRLKQSAESFEIFAAKGQKFAGTLRAAREATRGRA